MKFAGTGTILVVSAASLLGLATLVALAGGGARANHAGGMDAMSIDLDVTGNTATSLGPLDSCREVSPGETLVLDVTATNIPESNPLFGFSAAFIHPPFMSVESFDYNYLIMSAPGSQLVDIPAPQPTVSLFRMDALDQSWQTSTESGSGVLARLTFEVGEPTVAGSYSLMLVGAFHLDTENQARLPDVTNDAIVVVGGSCDDPPPVVLYPTPTPYATPTPRPATHTPTPSPTPTPRPTPVRPAECPERPK